MPITVTQLSAHAKALCQSVHETGASYPIMVSGPDATVELSRIVDEVLDVTGELNLEEAYFRDEPLYDPDPSF